MNTQIYYPLDGHCWRVTLDACLEILVVYQGHIVDTSYHDNTL